MGKTEPACPICGRPVPVCEPPAPPFPFCSDRCRFIDMGRWLGGRYRIPAEEQLCETDGESSEELPDLSA